MIENKNNRSFIPPFIKGRILTLRLLQKFSFSFFKKFLSSLQFPSHFQVLSVRVTLESVRPIPSDMLYRLSGTGNSNNSFSNPRNSFNFASDLDFVRNTVLPKSEMSGSISSKHSLGQSPIGSEYALH